MRSFPFFCSLVVMTGSILGAAQCPDRDSIRPCTCTTSASSGLTLDIECRGLDNFNIREIFSHFDASAVRKVHFSQLDVPIPDSLFGTDRLNEYAWVQISSTSNLRIPENAFQGQVVSSLSISNSNFSDQGDMRFSTRFSSVFMEKVSIPVFFSGDFAGNSLTKSWTIQNSNFTTTIAGSEKKLEGFSYFSMENCTLKDFDCFKPVSLVRRINIQGLNLHSVNITSFAVFDKLQEIYLRKCQGSNELVGIVQGIYTSSAINPDILVVMESDLHVFPPHDGRVKSFTRLNYAGNNITTLDVSSVSMPATGTSLILDLSRNPLALIEPGAFQGNCQSVTVYLNQTKLRTLNRTGFEDLLEKVQTVHLDGVPLACGCDIAWLILERRSLLSKLVNAVCYENGIHVTQLDKDNFILCTSGKCSSVLLPQWDSHWLGNETYKRCPGSSAGIAVWECRDGQRVTPRPDMRQCNTSSIQEAIIDAIAKLDGSNQTVPEVVLALYEDVRTTNSWAGDLDNFLEFFDKAIEAQDTLISQTNDIEYQIELETHFTDASALLGSYVMHQLEGWWGFPQTSRNELFAQYQTTFELIVSSLSEVLANGTNENHSSSHTTPTSAELVLQTTIIPDDNTTSYDLPSDGSFQISLDLSNNAESGNGTFRVNMVYVAQASDVLYGDASEHWWGTIKTGTDKQTISKINSPAVSINISEATTLAVPITFYLPKSTKTGFFEVTLNRVVFYEILTETACLNGSTCDESWSCSNCSLSYTNTLYVIRRNSTAGEAAKIAVNSTIANEIKSSFALRLVTIYGCVISSISLIMATFLFIWAPVRSPRDALKKDFRITVHGHLCFNLLVCEIVYVAGLEMMRPTDESYWCVVVAFLLHLSSLTTFTWMVVEALCLLFLVRKPLSTFRIKASVFVPLCYGLPLSMTLASFSPYLLRGPDSYLSDNTCWVGNNYSLIWGFSVPILLGVLFNLTSFISAMHASLKMKLQASKLQRNQKVSKAHICYILLNGFLLSFLLGITWIFTAINVFIATPGWAYAFTTINAVQGIFIFYYTCVANIAVRDAIKLRLRKHKARIANLSSSPRQPGKEQTEFWRNERLY